jgi:hypothetical protein
MPPVVRSTVPAAALKDLQRVPGIGPSLAADLVDLGIRRVADLRRRNPERLYDQLIALRGVHQDRCVLYTFRCAVYFAKEPNPEPERLKWWNWKDASLPRKARR